MELTSRRRRRINEVLFDYFVLRHILSANRIVSEEGDVDIRFLNGLAKELGCNARALNLSMRASCSRITGIKITDLLPKEEEEKVMLAAVKYRIMSNKQPLKNFNRGFGNLTAELNRENQTLKLRVEELKSFARPIYFQILDDLFDS